MTAAPPTQARRELRPADPAARRRPTSGRGLAQNAGMVAVAVVLFYLVAVPVIRLQATAFSGGGEGFASAFGTERIGRVLLNTVMLAVGSWLIALVLGVALAWAASKLPRRLAFLSVVPVLPIVIPAIAAVAGWAFLLSPRPGYLNAALRRLPWWSHLTEGPIDVYTPLWIVIITGISLSAFMYLFVSSGFANINSETLEAAQVAGLPAWRIFFSVTLPLLRPSIIYGSGVALLLGLGQFTGPLLLGTNVGVSVLTTEMYFAISDTPPRFAQAAAFGTPLLITGIAVVFAQRTLLGDQKRFVTHGGKAFRGNGRDSWLGVAFILTHFVISALLPLLALVFVAFSKFWSGKITLAGLTTRNFEQIMNNPEIPRAIINSLVFSLTAAAIVLPLGFLAARMLVLGQGSRVVRTIIDVLIALPLGIPAVIFGAGFLMQYTSGPVILYGTPWVVILVYVTLMLPFATRMQLSAMIALGETYLEAARASGSNAIQSMFRILLPLMRSSIGGAAALIFVLLTHEFTASLLVRASTTQVMGTALFDAWSNGSYPLVAAVALVMTGVTTVGVLVAMLVGGSDSLNKL